MPSNSEGHPKGAERRRSDEALAASIEATIEASRLGSDRLAEFARAPAATRKAFWDAVARRVRWDHALARYRALVESPEAPAPLDVRPREPERPFWNRRWRDRAYRDRAIEQRGRRVDDGFDSEKARLENLEAVDYVFRLTGIEANRAGYLHCPLPDHDERTPSFACKGTRWRCYGCQAHGSIYELAGLLWDLPRSGADFRRIHERLIEVYP